MQVCGHGQVGDNISHNCITDDDILGDIRDYSPIVELLPGISTHLVTAGGRSENPQLAEFWERTIDMTRKYMLQERSSGLSQKGFPTGVAPKFPGAQPLEIIPYEGVLQEGGIEQSKQLLSPVGPPLKATLAGLSPLKQRGHA